MSLEHLLLSWCMSRVTTTPFLSFLLLSSLQMSGLIGHERSDEPASVQCQPPPTRSKLSTPFQRWPFPLKTMSRVSAPRALPSLVRIVESGPEQGYCVIKNPLPRAPRADSIHFKFCAIDRGNKFSLSANDQGISLGRTY